MEDELEKLYTLLLFDFNEFQEEENDDYLIEVLGVNLSLEKAKKNIKMLAKQEQEENNLDSDNFDMHYSKKHKSWFATNGDGIMFQIVKQN